MANAVVRRTVCSQTSTHVALELAFDGVLAADDRTRLSAESAELARKPPGTASFSVLSAETQAGVARLVLRAPHLATIRAGSLLEFARDELLAAYLAEQVARSLTASKRPHACFSLRNILIERTGGVLVIGSELPAINALVSPPLNEPGERWRLLAPEAGRGELEDACSDVYTIGALYFEMLTGHKYRSSLSPTEASLACLEGAPANVREELSGVRASLVELLEAMLSPERSDRPQAAATAIRAEVARAGLTMIGGAEVSEAIAQNSLRGDSLGVLLHANHEPARELQVVGMAAAAEPEEEPQQPKRRVVLRSTPIKERVRHSSPNNERSLPD
jgi:hypothetical protein